MSIALLFSGQGSQYVGMGCGPEHGSIFRETWDEADEALGESRSETVLHGPIDLLTLTRNAQPAILTLSIAMYRTLLADRPELAPSLAAGHSLGEYSALVAAGVIKFADALRLVRLRGEAMQGAIPSGVGGMVAFSGLDREALMELCDEIGDSSSGRGCKESVVEVAAYNTPAQVVVAGHARALERIMERAQARGVHRSVKLQVSTPFHCSLLKPAESVLAEALQEVEFSRPKFPVFQNANGEFSDDPDIIRGLLVEQVSAPVLWVKCLEGLIGAGASRFIELGPGRGLTGMVKKYDRKLDVKFTDRTGGFLAL